MIRDRRELLRSAQAWCGGPHVEIIVRLAERRLSQLSAHEGRLIFQYLHIEGPYPSRELMGVSSARHDDWRSRDCSYAIWNLGPDLNIGVKVIPWHTASADLLLAVPPRMMAFCGIVNWPWNLGTFEWVTPEVIRLYTILTALLEDLHKQVPLDVVLIQEEGWVLTPPKSPPGIWMAGEVAASARFRGVSQGPLFCVPWTVPGESVVLGV